MAVEKDKHAVFRFFFSALAQYNSSRLTLYLCKILIFGEIFSDGPSIWNKPPGNIFNKSLFKSSHPARLKNSLHLFVVIKLRGSSEHLRNDLAGENRKYLEHQLTVTYRYLGKWVSKSISSFEKVFVKLINEFLLLLKSNQFQTFPLAGGTLLYSNPASRQLNLSLYGRHSPTLLLSTNLT